MITANSLESPVESKTKTLDGAEIAVTGRFATMTQAQIGALIRNFGGEFARTPSAQTRFLVVGQAGLPLEQDGKPSAALEKAHALIAHGSDLQIISEEAFIERLGVDHGSEGIRSRYTIVQLARLLKLPAERIRAWLKQGLIEPADVVNGLALFDFHQITAARTLCELIESGLAPSAIRKGLDQLRELLPDSQSPLLQVSALESTSQLLVRMDDGRLAEPSGQLRLDFESEPDDMDKRPRFIAVARSSSDLFADAVALEAAGRYDEAAETYRSALAQDPQNPILHFNLGNVLHRLGETVAAAEQFHLAVRIDPVYVEAWNNLACMLFETGQVEGSIEAFQRALKLAPSYEDARTNLATVTRRYHCQPS